MTQRGRFVSFEGLEGVGKSTCIEHFVKTLEQAGIRCLRTREPGGTPLAEAIRDLVLAHHDESMSDLTELLLMFAARAQNVATNIRPALERGEWVVCDRFTDATLAYQGFGRGYPLEHIYSLATLVHGDLWPDATILLEADSDVTRLRMQDRGRSSDRIEAESSAFFDRVGEGYTQLASQAPARFVRIDANEDVEGVARQLSAVANRLIEQWNDDR